MTHILQGSKGKSAERDGHGVFCGRLSDDVEKPSGRDAHLAEMKLAVNGTARARRMRRAHSFLQNIFTKKGQRTP